MDKFFEKAGLNDQEKYVLLQNSTVKHMDVAHFVLIKGANDYE